MPVHYGNNKPRPRAQLTLTFFSLSLAFSCFSQSREFLPAAMGQSTSTTLDATMDTVQHEFRKHSKVFSEISRLDYKDFLKCILELNEL